MKVYTHDEILNGVDRALIEILEKDIIENLLKKKEIVENLVLYNKLTSIKQQLGNKAFEVIRRINRSPTTAKTRRRPDMELLGGLIVIEIESSDSDIDKGKNQLESYIKEFYRGIAGLGIVTTGRTWVVFDIDNSSLKEVTRFQVDYNSFITSIEKSILDSDGRKTLAHSIEATILRKNAYKLNPTSDNIFKVFYPVLTLKEQLIEIINSRGVTESALYRSYTEILRRVYGRIKNEEIVEIFSTHTLIQMITNNILAGVLGISQGVEPLKICSGEVIRYEISIPHLLWWKEYLSHEEVKNTISSICTDTYYRALLFDWSGEIVEDVFSHLYEDFIDRRLRRLIGEYYTPWWLVELMIKTMKKYLGVGFKEKIVLDPACGSGRFIVRAFYEKVLSENEEPDKAFYEVLGLDISPIAVSLARAEIIIAYRRVTGRNPGGTPLVFWSDSLAPFVGAEAEVVPELRSLYNALWQIMIEVGFQKLLVERKSWIHFLSRLESRLSDLINNLVTGGLNHGFDEYMSNSNNNDNDVDKAIAVLLAKLVENKELIRTLQGMFRKYGNSIWAPLIASFFFVKLLGIIKPDIIVTNPPWLKLSELPESDWGEKVRQYVRNIVEKHKDIYGISKAPMAGDLSTVFLETSLKVLNRPGYIGIVLPADQLYAPSSTYGAGKLFNYAILRVHDPRGLIIYVGDAFKHGKEASVLIVEVPAK